MRIQLLSAAILLCAFQTFAQPGKYTALLIPDSLTKNADAVVREESTVFKVKDIHTASLQVHEVVTVMNSDGRNHLMFAQTSDKFTFLDDAEIQVYNALGIKLNTYTKKEMHQTGYGDGLVEDGRTTWFEVTAASYPITIETNYHIRFRGTLFYPSYDLQHPYQSVQQSAFKVEIPTALGLRYRCMNDAPKPQTTQLGETQVYSWEVTAQPARKMEKHSGSYRNYFPYVLLAPNRFQMDDYAGDMSSWKQFGQWYSSLIGNTNALPDGRKAFFTNLVKDATTDRQKAELIYRYLQQNMRYVSIQLGIGGWKPFAASFVDDKKYGDCKALSNYVQAALTAVGVKSYSTIIYSDPGLSSRMKTPLSEDFPMNRFNHVVVCVPQPKDSIWLECTSTTAGFGEMSSSTQNRKALLVTETGGVLVPTPASQPQQNTRSCHTSIQLADDGAGKVSTAMHATGNYRQELLYYIGQATNDEKTKYLVNGMDWKHPDALQINTGNKAAPVFDMAADMQYEKIPSFTTSNKMFLPVRLYPLMGEEVPENTKRTQDYFFDFPYRNTDTTVYHIPEGFDIDYKPADKDIRYPFGSYHTQLKYDAATRTLVVVAKLEIAQAMVMASSYNELSSFARTVAADTNEKIVVKRL